MKRSETPKVKVTLLLPPVLVRQAKVYGIENGRSLSDLTREGLEKVLAKENENGKD